MSLPNDCWQNVISFLNHKETINVAKVAKNLRTVVQKNTFLVIWHGVWNFAYPGTGWEDTKRIIGKREAVKFAEKQKRNPKVTGVWIFDSAPVPIGWISNSSATILVWERKDE